MPKTKKEESDDNNDDKEEVNISGCRRRIMNRPNKRNSKSKSFCEQRKFRSHSPMPERKQTLGEKSVKTKVFYITNIEWIILVNQNRICAYNYELSLKI